MTNAHKQNHPQRAEDGDCSRQIRNRLMIIIQTAAEQRSIAP